jgi:hypothetical protein
VGANDRFILKGNWGVYRFVFYFVDFMVIIFLLYSLQSVNFAFISGLFIPKRR